MDRPGRLDGRTVLIVGGTSGMGLAAARRFLQEGARVVVSGLVGGGGGDPASGAPIPLDEEAMAPLRAIGPCAGFSSDATSLLEVSLLFEAALGFLGDRLDIVFHAAGISGRRYGDGAMHDCTDDGWEHVMEANALATFHTNREAVRIMRDQPVDGSGLRGTVLNMGSVIDRSPSPALFGTIAYAASKGAVRALTLAAAARYAPERIRFNLIAPAVTDTPMAARAIGDPAIRAYLATKMPMSGGPAPASDVAEAALFLCEPASRLVTGAALDVDGGWRLAEGQLPDETPR